MDPSKKCYFLATKNKGDLRVCPLSELFDDGKIKQDSFDMDVGQTYFVFTDPSDNVNPGWPLRILLAAILEHCPALANVEIKVIGLRSRMNGSIEDSQVFSLKLPEVSSAAVVF